MRWSLLEEVSEDKLGGLQRVLYIEALEQVKRVPLEGPKPSLQQTHCAGLTDRL